MKREKKIVKRLGRTCTTHFIKNSQNPKDSIRLKAFCKADPAEKDVRSETALSPWWTPRCEGVMGEKRGTEGRAPTVRGASPSLFPFSITF